MKLWEMRPLSLLRMSFFIGVFGYGIIAVTPKGWGLIKLGFILTGIAGAIFCLYLFKRWPREEQSLVKKILYALGYAILALFAAGTVIVSVMNLFS